MTFVAYQEMAPLVRQLLIRTRGVQVSNNREATFLEIAETAEHDRRLTMIDIMPIPINTELVTLAACDTARAKALYSDDRLDLSRAFLIAGSAAVLATRWKVPEDYRTGRFLKDFYRFYRDPKAGGNNRKDHALKLARQEAINRNDPAQIWAAWVLIGDPR